MRFDRVLSLCSTVISLVAIVVSLTALRRDPLGTDLSKYDLSSPESTLRSINAIIAKQDLKAGWQLARSARGCPGSC
jgi:hypothetical protein